MPTPEQIRAGVTGMDQYRRPQQQRPVQQALPPPGGAPPMPTDFAGHTEYLLGGNMLRENPYFQQAIEDPTRRSAAQTFGDERSRISELAEQGGALGGDMYQSMIGRAFRDNAQATGDILSGARYQNYGDERNRQMQALAGAGAFETANRDRDSREEMTHLQAQLQRDLQSGQLDFGRQQLALEALNSLSRNDLAEARFLADLAGQQFNQDFSMMQLGGQLGTNWGNQALQGYGLVPGLEAAGYTGYNNAFGAEGQVNQMDAQAAAERARIEAQNQQNAWSYGRNNESSALQDYLSRLFGFAGVGGSSSTAGMSPGQYVPSQNPWVSGIGQGLAAYQQLGGTFGGGGAGAWGQGLAQSGITTDPFTGLPLNGSSGPRPGGGSSSGGGGGGSFGSSSGGWGSGFPSGFSPIAYGPQGWGTTFQGQGGPNPYAPILPFAGYSEPTDWNEQPVNLFRNYSK